MAKTIPNEEKVFMVSKSTNTTYSGSASLKAMQEWYTMEDVANTVKPYKVFTALLTQSGGDSLATFTSGIPIVIGVSCLISGNDGNTADFTNIGAPNNDEGTYFIATGTTPNSWGEFENAELSYNTGAPVATVLENTIGNVWFTYNDVGSYNINSDGLFTLNKSLGLISTLPLGVGDGGASSLVWQNIDTFEIETGLIAGVVFDTVLYNTPIEIRVYN